MTNPGQRHDADRHDAAEYETRQHGTARIGTPPDIMFLERVSISQRRRPHYLSPLEGFSYHIAQRQPWTSDMDYPHRRRQRLARSLKEEQLDVLLITNPVNVTYLTGFSGDSSYLLLGKQRV